ncbi:ABC transporter ATP-binding protein [Arthrobacter sp. NPDC090010]|uniref:ABC transporter ATP-binding protein n=1 Tax=Arthrobacter sp. NPDC090010 TaxID=3363942 RepID=UPI00382E8313
MSEILYARELSVRYPGEARPALNGVSLTITQGESVAIMGASGSGKTTLLHCLAGIIRPSNGSVGYAGPSGTVQLESLPDAARAALRRQDFGFVFQQGLLLNELTALENVAVASMLNGMPRAQAEAEASRWLDFLGLNGLGDRRLGELSGGQAQRVAIARAHITGARLIFADEPTGALDTTTSAEVLQILLGTVHEGRTLIMVTHDPKVAERCGRIVTLSDGRIVADTAAAPLSAMGNGSGR